MGKKCFLVQLLWIAVLASALVFSLLGCDWNDSGSSGTQQGSQSATWAKSYGGSSSDYGYSGTGTSGGGYAVAGSTSSFGAGGSDVWVLKLDENGDVTWETAYGGTQEDVARSIVEDSTGKLVVSGFYGDGNLLFMRLNSDGSVDLAESVSFGKAGSSYGFTVMEKLAGGYAVFGALDDAFLLVDLDSSGSLNWAIEYVRSTTYNDLAESAIATSDGGYLVMGGGVSGILNTYFYVMKVDSSGQVVWAKGIHDGNSLYTFEATDAVELTNGNFLVVGYGSFGGLMIEFDSSGTVVSARAYPSVTFQSITSTSGGDFIMSGSEYTNMKAVTVSVDSQWNLLWAKAYGIKPPVGNESAVFSPLEASNGVLFSGRTYAYGAGLADLWVFKTGLDGSCPSIDSDISGSITDIQSNLTVISLAISTLDVTSVATVTDLKSLMTVTTTSASIAQQAP